MFIEGLTFNGNPDILKYTRILTNFDDLCKRESLVYVDQADVVTMDRYETSRGRDTSGWKGMGFKEPEA